jgi:hypothetical protein
LDIHITPRTEEYCLPHGLIGQSYSCEKTPIFGEVDVYPSYGEYTTKAWARGAIDGIPNDYEMNSIYDTQFKFDLFSSCETCDKLNE